MKLAHRQFLILAAALSIFAVSTAWGGPNANGTLVLHDAGVISSDMPSFCGQGVIPSDCEHVDSRIDMNLESNVVWKIYAAFPPCGSSPRLEAVYFGVQYDPDVFVMQQHSCGDRETPTANWPASGSGLQVFWDSPRVGTLDEVCWFEGYGYPAPSTAEFRVVPHPNAGGFFVDDLVPPNLDPVAGYGTLGFNKPGQPVCGGWLFGACCHVDIKTVYSNYSLRGRRSVTAATPSTIHITMGSLSVTTEQACTTVGFWQASCLSCKDS